MDVVASSITIAALAVNVANSVVKLKKCWDSIQDAPEDIQFLIERVELLSQILRDVEEDQTQNSMSRKLLDDSTASKCLKTCKTAADRLRQLTEKMATSIDTSRQLKRKLISAKVVLKKDKILKFEKELQSCIALLQLSHETYTRSLLRLQPEIIYAKVVQAVSSGAFPTSDNIQGHQTDSAVASAPSPVTVSRPQSSEFQSYQSFWQSTSALDILGSLYFRTRYYRKKKLIGPDDEVNTEDHQELTARYRLPRWLANQAWDFCARKACNGWDFHLRQYVIIPRDSPVFEYIEQGDVRGLQELFSKREASPWSCDERGHTLLMYAFVAEDVATCRLLLDLGADTNYQNNQGFCLLAYLIHGRGGWTVGEADRLHPYREKIHDHDIDKLKPYRGTSEDFVGLQQCWFPEYYETSLEERFEVAAGLSRLNIWEPALFRLALSRNCIPKPALHMRDSAGRTLLHHVAWVIGSIAAESANNKGNKIDASALEDWRLILRVMITLGANLHPIDQYTYTPLIHVYAGFSWHWDLPSSEIPIEMGVDLWLSSLESCGVDLYEYGQREEELHARGRVWYRIKRTYDTGFRAGAELASFTYGRSPSEWDIKMDWRYLDLDQDSGQGPGKVEEMPGGWIKD